MTKLEKALLKFTQANKLDVKDLPELGYTEDDFRVVTPWNVGGTRSRAHYSKLGGK